MPFAPRFVDMNGDGIEDLISGSYNGDSRSMRTRSDGRPRRDENGNWWADIFIFYGNEKGGFGPRQLLTHALMNPAAFPVDWDDDGDYDLVTPTWTPGIFEGDICLMENIGTKTEPKFDYPTALITEEGTALYSSVVVHDWDGDGLRDLVAGGYREPAIYFFKNIGTKEKVKFAKRETLIHIPKKRDYFTSKEILGEALHIHVTDWDGDGVMDILAGDKKMSFQILHSLSPEEQRKVKEAVARFQSYGKAVRARSREIYAGVDRNALSEAEKKTLQQKIDSFRLEYLTEYTNYEDDERLRSLRYQVYSGRIWFFRGVK